MHITTTRTQYGPNNQNDPPQLPHSHHYHHCCSNFNNFQIPLCTSIFCLFLYLNLEYLKNIFDFFSGVSSYHTRYWNTHLFEVYPAKACLKLLFILLVSLFTVKRVCSPSILLRLLVMQQFVTIRIFRYIFRFFFFFDVPSQIKGYINIYLFLVWDDAVLTND